MLDNNTIYMKNKRYFVLCLLIVLRYFIGKLKKFKILSGRGGGAVGLSVRLARGRLGVRIQATTAATRIDAVFRLFFWLIPRSTEKISDRFLKSMVLIYIFVFRFCTG